jgi:hypothetical protein
MLCFNSVERDEDGWRSFLEQADLKLEPHSLTKIPGNTLAVLEVV